MSVLLKKFVTVARNLDIDSNSADLVSISLGVMKMLQETCKPNLIFKCSKCVFIMVHRNTNHKCKELDFAFSRKVCTPCCPTPPRSRLMSQHAQDELHHVTSSILKVTAAILSYFFFDPRLTPLLSLRYYTSVLLYLPKS